jgi:nucleotide-binding universal stress UspA family protein
MPVLVGIIAATWVAIGAALSVLMGRRGHEPYSWFLLGMFLGPIALPLAVYSDRGPRRELHVLAPPRTGTGPVDVLVGFDGSPEARAAVDAAASLLGSRVGRLTLVRVVPIYCSPETTHLANQSLRDEARRLLPMEVGLETIEGRPAAALTEAAVAGGYEVLAVGTRGAGLSTAVLGSTATELARRSKLPVLLVGGPEPEESS